MTENDIFWLDRCQEFRKYYTIIVDNDEIYVFDNIRNKDAYTFSEFGWRFALGLLRYIGCDAEEV